jgi:DNA invertase Pin-like site-specific DNA recombinase
MPVALYLRVSTEDQREHQSIATQREFAERYCAPSTISRSALSTLKYSSRKALNCLTGSIQKGLCQLVNRGQVVASLSLSPPDGRSGDSFRP